MDNKKKDRDISEREITEALAEIAEDKGEFDDINKTVSFLATILYNLRFDFALIRQEILDMVQKELDGAKEPKMKNDVERMYK